jgi:hypothetical protein
MSSLLELSTIYNASPIRIYIRPCPLGTSRWYFEDIRAYANYNSNKYLFV